MNCKWCNKPTGGTVQIGGVDVPICPRCFTRGNHKPLELLQESYAMYERHGDVFSRYAPKFRAILRQNKLMP